MNWIPVEKKLPEHVQNVLVYANEEIIMAWGYIFPGRAAEWCTYGHRGKELVQGVTHWMPLPEPPD